MEVVDTATIRIGEEDLEEAVGDGGEAERAEASITDNRT